MGKQHARGQTVGMATVRDLSQPLPIAYECPNSICVGRIHSNPATRKIGLCKDPDGIAKQNEGGHHNTQPVLQRPCCGGSKYPPEASNPMDCHGCRYGVRWSSPSRTSSNPTMLENCIEMGRDHASTPSQFCENSRRRDHYRLVQRSKELPTRSFSCQQVCSSSREICEKHSTQFAHYPQPVDYGFDDEFFRFASREEPPCHQPSECAWNQTWSNERFGSSCCSRQDQPHSGGFDCQAQASCRPHLDYHPVHPGSSCSGRNAGHTTCNGPPLVPVENLVQPEKKRIEQQQKKKNHVFGVPSKSHHVYSTPITHNTANVGIFGVYKRDVYAKSESTLPLHMGKVDTLILEKIREMCIRDSPHLVELLELCLKYVESDEPYIQACTLKKEECDNLASNLSQGDITKMLESDSFVRGRFALRLARVFAIEEEEKARRRQLTWPKQVNKEIEEKFGVPPCHLRDSAVHAREMEKGMYARCFDLTKSFLQVPLGAPVMPYLAFKYGDEIIWNTRLPMGTLYGSAVMNVITTVLATVNIESVVVHVHVDNVRFMGVNKEDVNRAASIFVAKCKEAHVTLNDEKENQLHQQGNFCGATCDYQNATICMANKTIQKLKKEREICLGEDATPTIHDLRVLYGLLFTASRILRIGCAQFFTPIKLLRRRIHEVSKGILSDQSKAKIWKVARPDLERWIDLCLENQPVNHPASKRVFQIVIATDASTTGYGAVFFNEDTGEVAAIGGKWKRKRSHVEINELEMMAVAIAMLSFEERIRDANVANILLLVDNTATMHTLHKGTSHAYALNLAAQQAISSFPPNLSVNVAYIESAKNVADAASRGDPISLELASELGAVGYRLAEASLRVNVPRYDASSRTLSARSLRCLKNVRSGHVFSV